MPLLFTVVLAEDRVVDAFWEEEEVNTLPVVADRVLDDLPFDVIL